MNRRDLLKFFGVGAIAAPVINGVVRTDEVARIVKPPTVEPATIPKVDPNQLRPGEAVVSFKEHGNTIYEFRCFVTSISFRQNPMVTDVIPILMDPGKVSFDCTVIGPIQAF